MLLKIFIFIVLLLTPPYGWVGLFLWFCWHATRETMKADKGKSPSPSASSSSAPAPKPEPELLTVKVNNGHCDLYTLSSGSYVRSLGADVVQACAGRDYVALVTRQGHVDIYRADSGSYVCSLSSDAVSAQIQGDDVAITDKNGRVDIYDLPGGFFRRSL